MKKNVPIHDLEENHDQPDVQFSMPVLRSNLNVMNSYSGISTVGSDGKFVPELRVFAGIAGIAILAGLTSILLFTKQLSTISSFEKVSLNYIGNVLALAPEALLAAVSLFYLHVAATGRNPQLRIPKLPIKRNLVIASELITPEIGDTTNELPSATLARLLRLSEQTPADRIKTIPNSGAIIRSLQLSSKSQYTNFAISLVKSLPNNAKSADIIKAANNCFSGKITPHQDRKFNYDLVEFRNNCILMDYKSEDEGKIDHALISQSILFSEVIGLIKHHHALAGISTAASAKAVTINKEELSLAEENLNRHLLEVYREMRSEGRDDGCLVVLYCKKILDSGFIDLVTALDVVGSLDKDISESVVSSKISTPAPALSTVKKKNDSPPPLPAAAFFDDELVGIEEGNHVIPQPPIKTPKGNSIDALVAERDELNKSSGSSI